MSIQNRVLDWEKRLKSAGVTVEDFCRRVQIDRATWYRWRSGEMTPSVTTYERALAALPPETEAAQ